jgi:choline kinase
VILAAGRGSRLGELTNEIPKCLNTYKGKSILSHTIDLAREFSEITRIVIVAGYKHHLLRNLGIAVVYNDNWARSGTFDSMLAANEILSTNESIICYSDIIFTKEFFESCIQNRADIFVPSNANFLESWKSRDLDPLQDLETFVRNGSTLIEIGSKPRSLSEIQGQFSGILKLSILGWDKLKEVASGAVAPNLDTTGLLALALKAGVEITTSDVLGFWKEFDLPSDFKTELSP